jgi:NitT/TauT family transport system substrate-binding protein
MVTDYGLAYDLAVPPDAASQTVADLKGARIGVSELSGAEVPVIRSLVAEAGMDPDSDVQMIEVGVDPAAVKLALEKGSINAVGATAGDLGIFKSTGIELRSVISEEQKEELSAYPSGALLATEEAAQDKEMLAAFGRAAAKGFLISYTNHEAALCIMQKVIPEEFVDPEAGKASFEGALEFTTAPQNPDGTYNFSAGNDDVDQWNRYVEIYVAGGLISEPFDMGPYIVDVNDEINDFDQAEVVEFAEGLDSDC